MRKLKEGETEEDLRLSETRFDREESPKSESETLRRG